jgi:hypothetical protein
MLAVPTVTPFAPITAILLAHWIPAPKSVEQKDAVAGVIIIVVPTPAEADIAECVPIVAVIISVIAAVRIAGVGIVIIAITGEAEANIIHASR